MRCLLKAWALWVGLASTCLGQCDSWLPVGSESQALSGGVEALIEWDEDGAGPGLPVLVAGGYFRQAAGSEVGFIARWTGSEWLDFAGGTNRIVFSLCKWDADGDESTPATLVAAGRFEQAGSEAASRIARWDGSAWRPLRGGLNDQVNSITEWDPDGVGPAAPVIVAGGTFTLADGRPANRIAQWDGTAWSSLGLGLDDEVSAVVVLASSTTAPDQLFAVGLFDFAGGVPARGVAEWRDGSWHSVGGSLDDGFVNTAITDSTNLVVGGQFSGAGGVDARNIAVWNGSEWRSMQGGLDNIPESLALWDGDAGGTESPLLVAVGRFYQAGVIDVGGIAAWDGERWSPIGYGSTSGISPTMYSVTSWDSDGPGPIPPQLIAGGGFSEMDGREMEYLARWQGCPVCPADFDYDGRLTIFDFLAFQSAFGQGDPLADLDGNGDLTIFDFLDFQGAFARGCP
jgi:hypothetical protein